MKIAVCDDEMILYEELYTLLNEYSALKKEPILTAYFRTGNDLLSSTEKFDLIFMDYQLDNIDGLETAKRLRLKKSDVAIIFLTAFPKIVFQSFEVNTFRFLVKPIKREELYKALDDYLESIEIDDFLVINTNDGSWKIRLSEIIYVESKDKHTIIRTIDNYFECCRYMQEIERMLPKDRFIRSHRSCIVSFLHIRNHDNKTICFDNNERATISRRYLTDFKKAFQEYIVRYNTKD